MAKQAVWRYLMGIWLALCLLVQSDAFSAHAHALESRAIELEKSRDWQSALKEYQRLYTTGQRSYPILINLARLSAWNRNLEGARRYYEEAFSTASSPQERLTAQLGQGEMLTWQKKYPQAVRLYTALSRDYPQSPEPVSHLAQVQAWQMKIRDAKHTYQENLRRFPTHVDSILGLAEVYAWENRFDKAIALYHELLQHTEEHPKVWIQLGKALAWQGKVLKAKETLSHALQLFPDNRDVSAAYLYVTQLIGKPDSDLYQQSNGSGDALDKQIEEIQLRRRPALNIGYIGHTEAGSVDEKLSYSKIPTRFELSPDLNTTTWVTFEPVYYTSGDNIEHEERYTYGLGMSRQWTDQVATSFWTGLPRFSNDGNTPLLVQASMSIRPSDYWQPRLSFDRNIVEESILSAAGLRPIVGPLANALVGRVIRNEAQLQNHFLFPNRTDLNLIFRAGWDEINQVENNTYLKAEYILEKALPKTITPGWEGAWYSNLEGGFWRFEDDRIGHGGAFIAVKPFGLPLGSDGISPLPGANMPGVGGYFSPDRYLYQTVRIGNRGQIWRKRLNYDVSAYAGVQDISRFGTDVTSGIRFLGELIVTKGLSAIINASYQNTNPFDQTTLFFGVRQRL